MAKKKRSSGRVTPKGTRNPDTKKSKRTDVPTTETAPPIKPVGKVNRQQGRGARPVSHNRGNR